MRSSLFGVVLLLAFSSAQSQSPKPIRFYHGSYTSFRTVDFSRESSQVITNFLRADATGRPCSSDWETGTAVNELGHGFYVFPAMCDAMTFAWGNNGMSRTFSVVVLEVEENLYRQMKHGDTGSACVECNTFYDLRDCKQHLCYDYSHRRASSYPNQIVFRHTPSVLAALRVVGTLTFPNLKAVDKFINPCRTTVLQDGAASQAVILGTNLYPHYLFDDLIENSDLRTRLDVTWTPNPTLSLPIPPPPTVLEPFLRTCSGIFKANPEQTARASSSFAEAPQTSWLVPALVVGVAVAVIGVAAIAHVVKNKNKSKAKIVLSACEHPYIACAGQPQ